MGVHSFVVTLATMSLYFGAMLVLTRAEAFSGLPPGFTGFGRLRHFGWVSALVPVALGTALLLALLFRLTALGREILAAGANARAAALSGVAVGRAIVVAHALSGALAGLAGVMLAMRNSAAIPGMAGQLGADWLLPAFLAPVLGGTPLTGGAVSVSGDRAGGAAGDPALERAAPAEGGRVLGAGVPRPDPARGGGARPAAGRLALRRRGAPA
jgi:ribose transport system permease protein